MNLSRPDHSTRGDVTALGPYGGGWLVDHASWRYVFLLNIPLVLPALWVLRKVPDVATRRPLSVDAAGGLLAVVGLGGVIYALTEAPASGWTSGPVLVTGLVGLAALAALVPVEQRRRLPMLDTDLFRSRTFDAINVATVIFYGALAAAGYLVVLQCELRLGYSATAAGAAYMAAPRRQRAQPDRDRRQRRNRYERSADRSQRGEGSTDRTGRRDHRRQLRHRAGDREAGAGGRRRRHHHRSRP
jgi:hypothetical protein